MSKKPCSNKKVISQDNLIFDCKVFYGDLRCSGAMTRNDLLISIYYIYYIFSRTLHITTNLISWVN